METPVILKRTLLSPHHVPTGFTRHYLGNDLQPAPYELRIVRYSGDNGYYLLYLDSNGEEQNDTYHDTLERALEQARLEFSVREAEWEMCAE
jgi:hypothetical protein